MPEIYEEIGCNLFARSQIICQNYLKD